MGESIHATMNSIGRKLAPIRPKSRRLWKIVEQYEMMNHVDKSLIAKKKEKNWKDYSTIRLFDYSDNNRSAGLVCIIINLT
jgi:hypothetical protein